jgi:hypothetical protein
MYDWDRGEDEHCWDLAVTAMANPRTCMLKVGPQTAVYLDIACSKGTVGPKARACISNDRLNVVCLWDLLTSLYSVINMKREARKHLGGM